MAIQRIGSTARASRSSPYCGDGWIYPVWVVGASRMRDVEDGWPAPGTKLHHSFGIWPLVIDDTTEVLELETESAAGAGGTRLARGYGSG